MLVSKRRYFLAFAVLLFAAQANINYADCPDITMVCPSKSGQPFNVGFCWVLEDLQCESCDPILDVAVSNCPDSGCDESAWEGRADGCSIPVPGLKDVWNEVFHQACNLHDLCYASPGHSQADCDERLFRNMVAICGSPGLGSLAYSECVESAGIIYAAVKIGGGSSYDSGQEWAKKNCK